MKKISFFLLVLTILLVFAISSSAITIQNAGNISLKDEDVNGGCDGTITILFAGIDNANPDILYKTIYSFDTSTIPDNARIDNATLRVSVSNRDVASGGVCDLLVRSQQSLSSLTCGVWNEYYTAFKEGIWGDCYNFSSGTHDFSANKSQINVAGTTAYWLYTSTNTSVGANERLTFSASQLLIDYSFPPEVNLNIPLNNANQTSSTPSFVFNVSDANSLTFECTLFVNSSSRGTNNTVLNDTTVTIVSNQTLEQGWHTWHINCTDNTSLTTKSESRNFFIDSIQPNSTIFKPQGDYNRYDDIPLNYSINDANDINECWYELNGANTSLTNCNGTQLYFSAGNYGVHLLRVFATDTYGNTNYSSVTFTSTAAGEGTGGGSSGGTRRVITRNITWELKPTLFDFLFIYTPFLSQKQTEIRIIDSNIPVRICTTNTETVQCSIKDDFQVELKITIDREENFFRDIVFFKTTIQSLDGEQKYIDGSIRIWNVAYSIPYTFIPVSVIAFAIFLVLVIKTILNEVN